MPWFKAKALADNPRKAHIVIDKPIGSDWAPDWIADFTGEKPARDFIAEVDALGELDEITVEINSPGGDVASGVRIYNYLKSHAAKVHTRVTGTAASIATIIMMAGDARSMAVGSTMMTHRASGLMVGFFNAKEMEETARNLKAIDESMIDIYVDTTGMNRKAITDLLDKGDTYLGSAEAIKYGFATKADTQLKAVASADPSIYMKQLEQSGEVARLRAEAEELRKVAGDLRIQPDSESQKDERLEWELAQAVTAPIAAALGMTVDEVIDKPEIAAANINARVNEAGTIAVDQERTRVSAIVKACQTTGQTQLLDKLIDNGMAEAQASEYIYDVAAASGNQHSIHNGHSPEGGHRAGIDHTKIYDRLNRKAKS